MTGSQNQPLWITNAILIGVLYCVVGILFAAPATHVQVWRFAAWITSAIIYATHIWYEYFRIRNSPKATALHVAIAVGIGGLGLAIGALIHALIAPPGYSRMRFGLALVLWPILTGLPAFLVALVITLLLNLIRPSKSTT
jgi:hypothetical protein